MTTTAPPAAETPPPPGGFDLYQAAVRNDPYPSYRWLLANDPVHQGAGGTWFISRYTDVRHVMADARFDRGESFRAAWKDLVGPGPLRDIMGLTIFFAGPGDHERLRGLIQRAFAPRVTASLAPQVAAVAGKLLDPALERGQMDAVADFAYQLPLIVLTRLLGIPGADREQLREWSLAIGPTVDYGVTPQAAARGNAAMGEFADYLRKLLPGIQRDHQDSLLGALAAAAGDGRLSQDELISMAITLILSGHETTTSLIANGVLALLRHPAQFARLRANPALLGSAVEEILRYDAPVQSNTREAREDTELGGRRLRRGDLVVVLQGAANRDPRQFRDPDRFDICRAGNHPVSFGAGPRFCLGATLARMEARAALGTLAERVQDVQLAVPAANLQYEPTSMFRALTALPVTLTPAGP